MYLEGAVCVSLISTGYPKEPNVQGVELRALRKSLEISGAELARELGIKPASLRDTEGAANLQLKTETRVMAAIAVIARRHAADRRRAATEALLSIAAV